MGRRWGPRLSSSVAISSIIIIALMLPIILLPPISSSLQLDIQLGVLAQQNNSDKPDVVITHGITSGDVTNESAVIWSHANQQAQINVEYDNNSKFTNPMNTSAISSETTDFTALALIEGLKPNTAYNYRVWFTGDDTATANDNAIIPNTVEIGTFKTAPNFNDSRPISFIWGGDLGGQSYCRNADSGGYSIFRSMQSLNSDFFIANGDMIYADGTCPEDGPILNDNINNQNSTWRNMPGDFKSINDPSVNWDNISEVRSVYQDPLEI